MGTRRTRIRCRVVDREKNIFAGRGMFRLKGWKQRLNGFRKFRIYSLSHVHWANDYLGLFGVLWVHMAWHQNCVYKKVNKIKSNISVDIHWKSGIRIVSGIHAAAQWVELDPISCQNSKFCPIIARSDIKFHKTVTGVAGRSDSWTRFSTSGSIRPLD